MKKQITTLTIAIAAFAIGMGFNNIAMSDIPANYKVAVVDVNAVVSKSAQVQALKKEQQTKLQELQKWLADAQADIAKQKTDAKKQELQKKYEAELAQKQQAIQSASAQKLQDFDNKLTNLIAEQAKSKGYDIVVAKGLVLYGGTDITQDIAKAINK